MLATEPLESRGLKGGAQVWVKLPTGELLAIELEGYEKLSDVL